MSEHALSVAIAINLSFKNTCDGQDRTGSTLHDVKHSGSEVNAMVSGKDLS